MKQLRTMTMVVNNKICCDEEQKREIPAHTDIFMK